jgi:hypothetical protein
MNDMEEQMFVIQLEGSEEFLNEKFEDMLVCTQYTSAVIVVGFVQRHMLYRSLFFRYVMQPSKKIAWLLNIRMSVTSYEPVPANILEE